MNKKSESLCRMLAIAFALTVSLFSGAGYSLAESHKSLRDTILFDRYKEFRKEAGDISPVLFSHLTHAATLTCPDCHPGVFVAELGANKVTEQNNMDGEYCGFCHGERLWECEFCHK